MRSIFDRLSTGILVAATTVMAVSVARREFGGAADASAVPVNLRPPEFVHDWPVIAKSGVLLGSAQAPIQVIIFSDLECPYCRQFHESTLQPLLEEYGDSVSWEFVHLPLSIHRFANMAANAAECAGDQRRFGPFVDAAYAEQDSFGLKPWSAIALDAGVEDTAAFAGCLQRRRAPDRIAAGVAVAKQFGVHGTPTILVNGWRYAVPPSKEALADDIAALLNGGKPHQGDRQQE